MGTWQALGLIPNTEHYRLSVITRRGDTHAATVRRGDNGSYYLALPDGVQWSDLTGWRPRG